MKVLRKIKEEKGSITMTVVAAMLFITSTILIAYFSLSNQSNDQSKKIRQIADSYKVTNSELIQKYKEVQDNLSDSNIITITAGQKSPVNSNAQYKSGNYKAIIPAGFTVSNEPGETSIETGLVIRDDDGNEFVWIPVGIPWKSDPSKTITLSRYTFDTNGVPEDKGANTIDYYYTESSSSSYENAVAKTDVTSANGFIAKTNAAGGFWIGRYEARTTSEAARSSNSDPLTSVTEKPGNAVYDYIKQTDASTKSREMYNENEYFESDLINSYAWDTATLFLQEYDNRTNAVKGNSNYKTKYSRQIRLSSGLKNTGTNASGIADANKDKICNVYDMADNCWEWSTETSRDLDLPCVLRGGFYNGYSNVYTSSRSSGNDTGSDHVSFRPLLYVMQN